MSGRERYWIIDPRYLSITITYEESDIEQPNCISAWIFDISIRPLLPFISLQRGGRYFDARISLSSAPLFSGSLIRRVFTKRTIRAFTRYRTPLDRPLYRFHLEAIRARYQESIILSLEESTASLGRK